MRYFLPVIVLSILVMAVSGNAAATEATLGDIDEIFDADDGVVYSHGPYTGCDTSCAVAWNLEETVGVDMLLSTRPQTPAVTEAERDLIVVGAPQYTNDALGMTTEQQDDGEIRLHALDGNRYVVTVRGATNHDLLAAGRRLETLLKGENTYIDNKTTAVVDGITPGAGGNLSRVPERFSGTPIIVHGSTPDAQRRAQDLAAEIGGEARFARSIDASTVRKRDIIVTDLTAYTDTPGSNQVLTNLTRYPSVWGNEQWQGFDGMRFTVLPHVYNADQHVLIATGDVNARTDHAVTFLKEVWNGHHEELLTGKTLTLDHLPRTLTITADSNTSITPGEHMTVPVAVKEHSRQPKTFNITVTRNGSTVTNTSVVSVEKQPGVAVITFDEAGNYSIQASRSAGFRNYTPASTAVTVEQEKHERSLLQRIRHWITSLLG